MAKAVTEKAPRQLPGDTGGTSLLASSSSMPPLPTSGAGPSLSCSAPLLSPSAFEKHGGDHILFNSFMATALTWGVGSLHLRTACFHSTLGGVHSLLLTFANEGGPSLLLRTARRH